MGTAVLHCTSLVPGPAQLVPRPRPAFCYLQYGKAGRARYLFSHKHDIIYKWQKSSEQKSVVSHIVQQTTSSVHGESSSRPLLYSYNCRAH